ncbi:uncharacterized protein LOC126999882 isoform X3 [Eriocheir sinensis]|uniref:uncharacterized protein LOC126999882 isoform X3 n=1 Tax=Eriocheir sinensis TaxID=95602 RepID=UPI0021C92916|nr:uncharacterized protein LOC126999882 isoform X3 [Eriocheir sinensis]
MHAMAAVCGAVGRLAVMALVLVSVTTGELYLQQAPELYLEQPPRLPRVYAAAPSGVDVTVVRAVLVDPGTTTRTPAHEPRFSLHRSDKTDYRFFNIDERHGNITTSRYLSLPVGSQYQLMVMVLASGRAIYKNLKITVSEYNKYAPVLSLQHYSAEVLATAGVGTPILQVAATDQDPVKYNKDFHYFLGEHSADFHLNPFLDPPVLSPLRIDPHSGVVRVARPLERFASPLQLLVGAVDGGSPQRHALGNLTVYIRKMPAPRSVLVTNTSETSLTVCWLPPVFSHPEGYILSYSPMGHQNGEGFLNLTVDQLHRKLSTWSGSQEVATRGDSVVPVYHYCAVVGDLMRWTQYLVGVRAWAGAEISIASISVKASTMSDYCAEGVCRAGNCTLQQDPPGYSCQCHDGYYGDSCEHHNPCLPENPCQPPGKCLNNSDGSYTCECLHGFYGPNCTMLDPCMAVSENPCVNGGVCVRRSKLLQNSAGEKSQQYECVCPEGYYGVTCEHQDPCVPNPCNDRGSCNKLSHANFSCVCHPGYTGTRCQEEVNECEPNPCKGGKCTDLFNDYHCHCPEGWGGKNCEEDLESCPVQTTDLNTGEFLWPATHHGESVTISCPYGTRIPAFEEGSTTETDTPFDTTMTSGNYHDFLDFEEAALSTETPHASAMTATYAALDGGSFHINRKSRDVFSPSDFRRFEGSFQERRHRILSSIRASSPRRSDRRHSLRQSRQGGQGRHETERQESHTDNEETGRHLYNQNQTNSARDREQEPDVKKHIDIEHGRPDALTLRSGPRTEPLTDSRSKVQDTNKHMTSHSMPDRPQVHPILIKGKKRHLSLPDDYVSYDDYNYKYNPAYDIDLQTDDSAGTESESTDVQSQKKRNKSRIRETTSITPASDAHHTKATGERVTNHHTNKAVRSCILLPNGTVTWRKPDTSMCREKAMQVAEKAAQEVVSLTNSPSTVNSSTFTHAADQLAVIVEHAIKDQAVAKSMVTALSNLMEVNDSVVAAVDKKNNVTKQILKTIKSFTEKVALRVGEPVKLESQYLVVEARLLDSSVNENIIFDPRIQKNSSPLSHSRHRRRSTESSAPTQEMKPYISLPPEVLKLTGKKNVRLEFVSFANDKFFRSHEQSGLPVITATITNTEVSNLSHPVVYEIPLGAPHASGAFQPVCVFWDEKEHRWSTNGLQTVQIDGRNVCQASHLTAFSILLDPLPAELGSHAEALSIITYVGLILSTAALMATVATYALFRTLNRDRSGKIVMNLSLVLLLLNIVFIIAVKLKPPSVECTALAAILHYLVVSAFAWMLVEAANMYQLLITVFASAETHFMAKRVFAAWGIPVVLVVIALSVDKEVYGDPNQGYCVISPASNPALYYSTYLGPICLVLLVNCIVFVMVTRVLCQRRPRPNRPRAPSSSPSVEMPITLAQVRGAVTVVALLGITWVAGALSVGGARLIMQYIFCLTTPLQGLIIFIVRVAQHPEARAAWITLFTTGTLRRRPPTTHTHSTHSSGHTHSTSSMANTPRNNNSSTRTTSTRISLRTSPKPTDNTQKNGSVKSWSSKNGNICKYASKNNETDSSMGTLFTRLVKRLSTSGQGNEKDGASVAKNVEKTKHDLASVTLPDLDCPSTLNQDHSYFCEAIPEKPARSSYKNKPVHRPQSLVLLRTDSHGSVMATQASTLSQDCINPQYPLLSSSFLPQELVEAGIPSSMVPRRSLGSLMLITGGKEGDDSSWHFVRPPPDGHSNPVSEGESVFVESNTLAITKGDKHLEKLVSQTVGTSESRSNNGCVVLSGQRVATKNSAISEVERKFSAPNLTRANSESQMNTSVVNPADLRRSASVYTLGEWEDPRSSLA